MTEIPIDARVSVLVDCARCARRVARGTVLGTGLRRHDDRCAVRGPLPRPSSPRRPESRRCADAVELIAPEAPNRHSSGSARWLLTVRTECRPRNRSGYRPSPARRQVRRQGTLQRPSFRRRPESRRCVIDANIASALARRRLAGSFELMATQDPNGEEHYTSAFADNSTMQEKRK